MSGNNFSQFIKGLFWSINLFLVFFLYSFSSYSASLPMSDIKATMLVEPHEETKAYPNWSLWLEEGNVLTFKAELERVSACVKAEKADVYNIPKDHNDMTECQREARSMVLHRDKAGHGLLQTYMKFSNSDAIGDPLSVLVIKEAVDIIELLGDVGVLLFDWDQKQADTDNVLFLAIKYDKLGLLNQLLLSVKKGAAEKVPLLSKMRSDKGVSLGNALLEKYPSVMRVALIILNYGLQVDDTRVPEDAKVVYGAVQIMRTNVKHEL